jgi:hypothetical protein
MTSTRSITLRLMAAVMAVSPLCLAILFHTGIRSTPLSIEAPAKPSLAFHQYAVDLRKIHPTAEAHATFIFQNRGSEPIQITAMEPSCGCLTPLLQGDHNKVIPAGEHGRVVVRMQPANSTVGPHEYTVNVKYTDSKPREVLLTMKLEIPATMLTVSPPALIVYHPEGSEPTPYDFTITDGRGKRFEITGISINSELVETAIGETSRTPTGNFQQTVRVNIAGNLPPVRTQALLRIQTDDPDIPELRVPMMLQGQTPGTESESDHGLDHEHRHSK